MKTLLTTIATLAAALMIAGPAAAKSWQQCDYEAKQYALGQTNPGGAAVGGAIAGGLLGLGISSITGNQNTAAAVGLGAVGGGAAGLVLSTAKQKQLYDTYMASCLGGSPQPIYAPVPQPGTLYPPPGPQAGVYQSLNVRVCPQASAACPSIGSIQPGSIVTVDGCTSPAPGIGWCHVGLPQGWGWASKKYLYF
jgi:hypothetical protein